MKSLLNSIGRAALLATLMAVLFLSAGCDMGTYENRLNDGPANAPTGDQ